MLVRCLPLLIAACLLATGCGGDGSKKKADPKAGTIAPPGTTAPLPQPTTNGPDATVRNYFLALARRDGASACSRLTPQARRTAIATVQGAKKKTYRSCGKALEAVVAGTDDKSLQALDLNVTKSVTNGDRAKVAVENGTGDIQLQKLRGRWYITGGIG